MFGFPLGDSHDAATASSSQYIGLQTPVRFDAKVLEHVQASWAALQAVFDLLVRALHERNARSAEMAARVCARQLHELQCQEAMRVFPVIAHHLGHDETRMHQLAEERLELNRLARRFLRQLDLLAHTPGDGGDLETEISLTRGLLDGCVEDRRYTLYRLYAEAQTNVSATWPR